MGKKTAGKRRISTDHRASITQRNHLSAIPLVLNHLANFLLPSNPTSFLVLRTTSILSRKWKTTIASLAVSCRKWSQMRAINQHLGFFCWLLLFFILSKRSLKNSPKSVNFSWLLFWSFSAVFNSSCIDQSAFGSCILSSAWTVSLSYLWCAFGYTTI